MLENDLLNYLSAYLRKQHKSEREKRNKKNKYICLYSYIILIKCLDLLVN